MSPKPSSSSQAEDRQDIPTPSWDTSPITLPAYVLSLRRWLPLQDARYKTLVTSYTVNEKHKVLAMSDNHIDRILNGVLPTGTFEDPTIVAVADVVTHASTNPGPGATSARHVVSPERITEMDYEMFQTIAGTIHDRSTVKKFRTTYHESGCLLLEGLTAKVSHPSTIDHDHGARH